MSSRTLGSSPSYIAKLKLAVRVCVSRCALRRRQGLRRSRNTYHGDNHPGKPKPGFLGTPDTEARRERLLPQIYADKRRSREVFSITQLPNYSITNSSLCCLAVSTFPIFPYRRRCVRNRLQAFPSSLIPSLCSMVRNRC